MRQGCSLRVVGILLAQKKTHFQSKCDGSDAKIDNVGASREIRPDTNSEDKQHLFEQKKEQYRLAGPAERRFPIMNNVVSFVVLDECRIQIAGPFTEEFLVRAYGFQHDFAANRDDVEKYNGYNGKLCGEEGLIEKLGL